MGGSEGPQAPKLKTFPRLLRHHAWVRPNRPAMCDVGKGIRHPFQGGEQTAGCHHL